MINYPNGKKSNNNKNVSFKNRGMSLESDINNTNQFYLEKGIANIHKKPTPIKILSFDRFSKTISKAVFETPSTTDYNGIYKGKYIDFEAKETSSKTLFPIKNIHIHQIKHLIDIRDKGGIAFLIIRFNTYMETYYLSIDEFEIFYKRSLEGRKSISYEEIKDKSSLIKYTLSKKVDYLEIVDNLLKNQK